MRALLIIKVTGYYKGGDGRYICCFRKKSGQWAWVLSHFSMKSDEIKQTIA